uniref:Probable oligoribonuclease n=1 Tax=Parascaris univalens TaxID=6257 RepID=A0A915BI68_PARUN
MAASGRLSWLTQRLASGMGARSERLIWMDCEMTGLDVWQHTLVEIACIVTEADLSVVAEGPDIVISQPENVLANMNSWCRSTFARNGLLQKIRESNISVEAAESQMLSFLKEHTDPGKCPLAGNSVYMDRVFIERYMPNLIKHLHYRIVDVSTIKEVARRWYPLEFTLSPQKQQKHRALDDIRESIQELQWYRAHIFK